MYSVYICRNCGAEYDEKPEYNFCFTCHENEVFNSDYVRDYWDGEER